MKLLVGLGNPGRNYENTRHNAGFSILEKLNEKENGKWGNEAKANALISRIKLGNEDVILALPQSYMNLSGEAVVELLRWFKLDISDLIVIHDELDLPFGKIQIKKGIGTAGHKGIKSIIERIGEDFVRVRIGIGIENLEIPSEKFVLEKFSDGELQKLEKIEDDAIEKLKLLVKHGYEEFVSKYNK
jgi:PTH1 family peptidyl-tRNA hydrolase